MKLTFLGATHEVTGSCTLLSVSGKNILIDYGMEQGKDIFVNEPIPLPVSQIDLVLLTHAHIDHSGLLPVLYQKGYDGPIHAPAATTRSPLLHRQRTPARQRVLCPASTNTVPSTIVLFRRIQPSIRNYSGKSCRKGSANREKNQRKYSFSLFFQGAAKAVKAIGRFP